MRYCSKDRQINKCNRVKDRAFMELICDRSDISDQWDYLENCPLRNCLFREIDKCKNKKQKQKKP